VNAEPTPPNLLVRPGSVTPFDRGNGVRTLPHVGVWNCRSATLTTGITAFAVGTGLPLHTHNVEESVLLLEGRATVTMGEETFAIEPGTSTWVPAGVPHRFVNSGDTAMRIFWVYGGLHVTRTICATGETFAHLSDGDRGGITLSG